MGIGVGDRVAVLENAYYSVISPEGCAAILWKDRTKAPDAAAALKLTAKDLLELKLIDEVIKEPLGGAHQDMDFAAEAVKASIRRNLKEIDAADPELLVEKRYEKFRQMGAFQDIVVRKKHEKRIPDTQ